MWGLGGFPPRGSCSSLWCSASGIPGSGCLQVPRFVVRMHVVLSSGLWTWGGELTPTSPCFGSELGGTMRAGACLLLGLLCWGMAGLFLTSSKGLCCGGWSHQPPACLGFWMDGRAGRATPVWCRFWRCSGVWSLGGWGLGSDVPTLGALGCCWGRAGSGPRLGV
jgi:hypothetical protein